MFKDIDMKHILTTLMASTALLTLQAQTNIDYPYNPDENADSFISTPDLMEFLVVFGSEWEQGDIVVDSTALSTVLSTFQAQITALQAQVEALQAQVVPGLASYLSVDDSLHTVLVEGANFQVTNGWAQPYNNGLGNVIVGFNPGDSAQVANRGGSHNVIVGSDHQYNGGFNIVAGAANDASGVAGLVSGESNVYTSGNGAMLGGLDNACEGQRAVVVGGLGNAAGHLGVAVGGQDNYAGEWAVVVGGLENTTLDEGDVRWSTVVGGVGNQAAAMGVAVGGAGNVARFQAVSAGGQGNDAGYLGSILGGYGNSTYPVDTLDSRWATVVGGGANEASGMQSLIAGGAHNVTSDGAIFGGRSNYNSGEDNAIFGGYNNAFEYDYGDSLTAGNYNRWSTILGSANTVVPAHEPDHTTVVGVLNRTYIQAVDSLKHIQYGSQQ